MGVYNSELFTNLGLCCFYAQQYDMTLNCFERALALASDENMADVWYNIGHVALVCSPFLVYCVCSVKDLKVIRSLCANCLICWTPLDTSLVTEWATLYKQGYYYSSSGIRSKLRSEPRSVS